jgi:large subunit ribosomal protein L10
MAVTKAKKIEQTGVLTEEFSGAETAILTSFSKLKASQAEELRKTVRSAGAKYRVVKNTLAERAGKGTKIEQALQNLSGVTSVAYTSGDPVALAKALAKYAKDNPEVTVKAVVLEGKVLPAKEVETLANMPSKEEIYSKLLFLINAPAQRLVTVLNAAGRDLAVVIDQGVKETKFAGGGETAASA